jgi:hypothetical protein
MESEPLLARIVPCPRCGRPNPLPARASAGNAVCSECQVPLATQQAQPTTPPASDKAARLFRFLKELVELRSRAIRTLDRYENVLWVHDIPKHPLCHSIDWSAEAGVETPEAWIELKKPNLTAPPPLSATLMSWIDSEKWKDSSSVPVLRERVPGSALESRGGEDGFLLLHDHPEVSASWERYLGEQWKPWAERDRELRPVQRVYNTLFSIYQKQKKLGEAYDLVLGLGLLVWTTPSNHEIRRHLVTCQTSVTFDAERGLLTVGPAATARTCVSSKTCSILSIVRPQHNKRRLRDGSKNWATTSEISPSFSAS